MNRLQAELQRLYASVPDRANETSGAELAGPDGRVRAMVLELARPASWNEVSAVWQGVQAELALPAPGIAVAGVDSYQLWFSLEQPVAPERAAGFLAGLRDRYLREVPPEALRLRPSPATAAPDSSWPRVTLPPAQVAPERWAAFVAPDLAALFADEPWIDQPPGLDAQAELLSRLQSITPEAFERSCARLAAPARPEGAQVPALAASASVLRPEGNPQLVASAPAAPDPRRFLLAVMQDPAVALELRVEAAKALLPYTEAQRQG